MAKIEIVYDVKGNVLVTDHAGATEFFFCDYNVPEKLTKLLSEVLGIACAASGTRSFGLSRIRKGGRKFWRSLGIWGNDMAWKFLPFIRNRKDAVADQDQENKKDLNRITSNDKIKRLILRWYYLQNDRSRVEKTAILREMFGPRTNDLLGEDRTYQEREGVRVWEK